MIVTIHQDISVKAQMTFFDSQAKQPKELFSVTIVSEDSFRFVAARSDMMVRAGILNL
jgi:hypothetical protein